MEGPCDCEKGFTSGAFTGGLSVGVPGVVAAIHRLLNDHGTQTLKQVAALLSHPENKSLRPKLVGDYCDSSVLILPSPLSPPHFCRLSGPLYG